MLACAVAFVPACGGNVVAPGGDSDASAGDAGGDGSAGYGGGQMVWVPDDRGGTYGIDRAEVTNEQYLAWINSNPSTDGQPEVCAWNHDFTPVLWWSEGPQGFDPRAFPDRPVVVVDWCDASAFCRSAGKRLCGRVGGGALHAGDAPAASQLANACSSAGANVFPYGNTYDAHACNGLDAGMGGLADVGSFSHCHPADARFEGIVDLSGNAAEWQDACEGEGGKSDWCVFRGGDFLSDQASLSCQDTEKLRRSDAADTVGFRCCSDP